MNKQPSLDDLRVFCTVARCGSFVAAARELGASPAFVSKRIGLLEARLDVQLLHRTTRRVRISDDGERVYGHARRILEDVAAMTEQVGAGRSEPVGLLRVATSVRLGRRHVAPILAQLQARHPRLDVWLELLDRRADLIGEDFDIDIRVGEPSETPLIAHRIAASRRVLCAAPAYLARRGVPQSLAELARHECLLFRDREQAFGSWRLHGPRGLETVKVQGRLGSNLSDAVRAWALMGHGVALLSQWDVSEPLAGGELARVLPAYHENADIWAMTSQRTAHSAKVRVAVGFLRQALAEGPHALRTTAA